MQGFWSRFKYFWLQEEVPRWIGLSLVALYTVGLAGVAWTALSGAQEEHQARLEQASAGALHVLADSLAALPADGTVAQQCLLRSFAGEFSCSELRLVDSERTVLASMRRDEVGQPGPAHPLKGRLVAGQLETMPVAASERHPQRFYFRTTVVRGSEPAERYLQGVWTTAPPIERLSTGQALTLGVILAALGALFLLYRRMREHFRGVSRIAENLVAGPDVLTRELESLRVADTLGAVAGPWNSLIDLMEELRAESQRAEAAQELRRALERSTGGEVADALNALPEGLLLIADGETVRHANAKVAHLLGWGRRADDSPQPTVLAEAGETPIGKRLVEIVRNARGTDRSFHSANELLNDAQDGSTYRVRVLPLSRNGGRDCLVMVADVSQQVQADKAREDFVSQVTHELRTPLTNIRAYAETLSSGMFDDPKVITDCYNVITKETRRLSRLIEDILSISQIEAGDMQLVEDDVDVRTLLSDGVRDVRGLADEKKIDLQMDLPAKLGTLQGDRDKLAVVINNLLGNALKYTRPGGMVRLSCKMSEQEVRISVKDTGIGIDPRDHERIFEKFQRADDPEVRDETGTGIGLTTAREIVRRHGGEIELVSAKGEGSTFVVRIPVGKRVATAGTSAG